MMPLIAIGVFMVSSAIYGSGGGNSGVVEVGSLLIGWYMGMLESHPFLTKSFTASLIGCLGDFLAQLAEHFSHLLPEKSMKSVTKVVPSESESVGADIDWLWGNYNTCCALLQWLNTTYDRQRGLALLVDGFVSAPIMHIGYDFFEAIVPVGCGHEGTTEMAATVIPESVAALIHVLLDLILLDSIFIATTFVITGIFEGYSFRQVIPQLRSEYVPALKASWGASLAISPIQYCCFRYCPVALRVLGMNGADVFCDAVLSFMAHRKRRDWKREAQSWWNPTTSAVANAGACATINSAPNSNINASLESSAQ